VYDRSAVLIVRRNVEARTLRVIFVLLFLLGKVLLADTDVTSREQFSRLMPGGLPDKLHYNSDRASLELRADDANCPIFAHGFFELKINEQGDVTSARDVNKSRSANLKGLTTTWIRNILMQIHFQPLKLGSKTTSVHTFATVVCQ
jgi:hypothetical protein